MPPEIEAVHVVVKGRVQGVGYRFFTQDAAGTYGLTGWVRNVPDGNVECVAEGPRPALEGFIAELRKGPPMAHVEDIQIDWRAAAGQTVFQIR